MVDPLGGPGWWWPLLLGFTPLVVPILLVGFIAVVALTRYVSLGSILAAVFAPLVAWLLGEVQPAQLYLLLAVIVAVKHHANIARLLKGEESKLSFGGARS